MNTQELAAAHFEYRNTEEAYNASQTTLANGSVLFIPTEQVVGFAWTWPVAITVNFGDLHTVSPSADAVQRVVKDAKFSWSQVEAAIRLADAYGYPVRPEWRDARS